MEPVEVEAAQGLCTSLRNTRDRWGSSVSDS